MKRIILLGIIALTAAASQASEVVATVQGVEGINAKAKGQMAVGLDIESDGTIAGFSFKVVVPGLDESKAVLKSCVSELPKGFTGQCSAAKGGIYVIASADAAGTTLPKGVVPVGTVYFSRAVQAKAQGGSAITVTDVEFSDDKGHSVSAKAKVAAE